MSAIPRNEGESFEDYRLRRAADHQATYNAAYHGVTRHDSYLYGTYRNPQRAAIKAERKARKDKRKQMKGVK